MRSLTISDKELIHLYINGNTEALSTLVTRHKNKLFTSIYLLVKDKYLAEDIFQDTFIKIIDTLKTGRYKDEGKFLRWAMRIAHNLSVDHFRKIKRSPKILTSDKRNIFDTITFSENRAEENLIKKESHARVNQMIEILPQEQREVIIMRHYADLSFKEIATLTNCSINTALGRMRYGLMNLRKLMAEKASGF